MILPQLRRVLSEDSVIVLENEEPSLKLPFMYCMVYSLRLAALSYMLNPIEREARRWIEYVDRTQSIPSATQETASLRALLKALEAIHNKGLIGGGSRPPIFWFREYAALYEVYANAAVKLQLEDRYHMLSARMHFINETLEYLGDEMHEDVTHRLEYVIILLVGLEVALSISERIQGKAH